MLLVAEHVARGRAALSSGDWLAAREAYEQALALEETPSALEGLSQALWWTGDEETALATRERAHLAYRRAGDKIGAVRSALWAASEYRTVLRNEAASNGWFTRAKRLVDQGSVGVETGWLALARSQRAEDPEIAESYARDALSTAEKYNDLELEVYALGQLGLARLTRGEVNAGLSDLDEAMAAATSQDNPVVAGDTACALMQASELIGDMSRFEQWAAVIERYVGQHGHLALLASCGTCCGAVFAANGHFDVAERELTQAIAALERSGQPARCSHPSARLAQLRILQGRLEDAEAILAPFRHLPEAIEPTAALYHARGDHRAAIRLLERRLHQLGESNLRAVPLLAMLNEARVAAGDLEGATREAERLAAIADVCGLNRVRGLAALARGQILSKSDSAQAEAALEQALTYFDRAHMPFEQALARLETARLQAAASRELAVAEARSAHQSLVELGASHMADEAAAFLRSLGVRGQTGPKTRSVLSQREEEVLDLIAAGLTNAEIADRLFISQKTAANHVSNVLTKLGVRSRTEAAAVALRSH